MKPKAYVLLVVLNLLAVITANAQIMKVSGVSLKMESNVTVKLSTLEFINNASFTDNNNSILFLEGSMVSTYDLGKLNGDVTFNGGNNQSINAIVTFNKLTVDKSGGNLTVERQAQVDQGGTLILNRGIVFPQDEDKFSVGNTYSLGSSGTNSYVSGSLGINYNNTTSEVKVPVGKSSYKPIEKLTSSTAFTGRHIAEFFEGTATGTLGQGIDALSTNGYWRFIGLEGQTAPSYSITLPIDADPFTQIALKAEGSNEWTLLDTEITGGFATANNVTSYGEFTYVSLAPITYTITASAGNNGTIDPTGDVIVEEGNEQTFTITPNNGFVVEEVLVDGNPVTLNGNTYTFNNVSADATIQVSFVEEPTENFTITASVNGNGGNIDPVGQVIVEGGQNQTFTFTPNNGFVVNEVLVDGNPVTIEINSYTFNNVSADATIQVSFVEEPTENFTITASVNGTGGNIDPIGQVIVEGGQNQIFTFTPNNGFIVNEILVDGNPVTFDNNSFTFENVTADATIEVSFIEEPVVTFTITPSVNGENGTITPDQAVTVEQGQNQAFTFAPEDGFIVNEVLVDGNSVTFDNNSYTFNNVSADATIQVSFVEEPTENFTITASVNGTGGTIDPTGDVTVGQGLNQKFTFAPEDGFIVNEVLVDGNSVTFDNNSYTFENVTADATIQVSFIEEPTENFTITASVDGIGGTIDPTGDVIVGKGLNQKFTFAPEDRFIVNEVLVDGNPVTFDNNSYTFENVTADATIQVSFIEEPTENFTITASVNGNGGNIDPVGQVIVEGGQNQTFTFTPNNGFIVNEILVDGNPVTIENNAFTFVNVTANITIVVSFIEDNNQNNAPTDINISNNEIDASAQGGSLVGTLSTIDADLPNDAHTYSISDECGGTNNNALFDIQGTELRLANNAEVPKGETQLSVCVTTTDNEGLAFSKVLTFTIINIVEDLPDLTVANAALDPSTVKSGQNTKVTWAAVNDGLVGAPTSTVQVYFSTNQSLENDDALLFSTNLEALQAGNSVEFDQEITIPENLPDGNYFILIVIDGTNAIEESNEGNNLVVLPISVITPPEITIMNVITPNGDGENDELYIENIEFYPESEVIVLDTKGNELYRAENGYSNDWFPNYRDEKLAMDSYLCIVKLKADSEPLYKMITILID